MLARHVSDLTDPSSGGFVYKQYVQIWYVVICDITHGDMIWGQPVKELCCTELIAVQDCNAITGLTRVARIVAEPHVLEINSIMLITPT